MEISVLFVLPYVELYPILNGGMNRYFHILHQLSIHSNLTIITFADAEQIKKAIEAYPSLKKAEFITIKQFEIPAVLAFLPTKIGMALYSRVLTKNFFQSASDVLLKFDRPMYGLLSNKKFDVIVFENLSSLDLAKRIKCKFPGIKLVYDAHNFDTEIAEADYKFNRINRNILNHVRRKERGIYKYIDCIWTCSERDAELFRKVNKKRINQIHVIPNGTEITPNEIKVLNNPIPVILFVGSLDYFPNEEGIKWFLRKVTLNIQSDFIFKIVGSGKCSFELKELVGITKKCELIGFVEDLHKSYIEADLVVIPILSGSGTRLKVLEAMKFQKAIVCTSKGVEGIHIVDEVIIEDEPIKMAQAIDRILSNNFAKEELGIRARRLVEKFYDWEKIGRKIKEIIE